MTARLLVAPALAVALVAAAPPPAAAEDARRSVAVVDISEESKTHAEIAREIRDAVAAQAGYTLKEPHGPLNAGGEEEDQNNVKTAEAFHRAGRAALKAGEAEDAVEQLESAAGLMQKSLAFVTSVEEYQALLLQLGKARAVAGDAAGARTAFEQAVLFRAEPTLVTLSDDQRRLFEAAREAVLARPRGAILVRSEPAGAEVYVDGRYRGISPATVAGLPEGQHDVALHKVGWKRETAQVTASTAGLTEKEIRLVPARRQPLYEEMLRDLRREVAGLDPASPVGGDGVRQAGSLFFAELALVVRTETRGDAQQVELLLFHAETRKLLNRVSESLTWSRREREVLDGLVARVLDVDYAQALGGADAAGGVRKSKPVTKQWWFWTAIGVGVAGAATAAILIATSGEESTPPTSGSLVLSF